MPDKYGDYRDTQRRFMHRPDPKAALGFSSRLFVDGEAHDTDEGWTHHPDDAIARGKAPVAKPLAPVAALVPPAPVVAAPAQPVEAAEDDSETIPLETTLAALKRPALLKMAAEQQVIYDTGWTAAQLREAILKKVNG